MIEIGRTIGPSGQFPGGRRIRWMLGKPRRAIRWPAPGSC